MSESSKLSTKEVIERYKKVRKERRRYAIKSFFKIKRGAFGLIVLVALTVLSVLSPWLAPKPHKFRHAPLSRPEWFRIFDPNALGGDFYITKRTFAQESDIRTSPTDISNIPDGVIYPYFNIPNVFQWPSLTYRMYIDNTKGAKTPDGAAVLEIIDDTQYRLESIPENYTVAGFCFNIHWNYSAVPYRIYLWFARKYELQIPPIYKSSYTIPAGSSINDYIFLNLSKARTFTVKIETSYDVLLNVTVTTDVQTVKYADKGSFEITVEAAKDIALNISNTGTDMIPVNISIEWQPTSLFEVLDVENIGLYLMSTLWDPKKGRTMTGSEVAEYSLKKFAISVPDIIVRREGLVQYGQKPIEKSWINESYDISEEAEPTQLISKGEHYKVFFQKGNISVFRFIIKFRYASKDILKLRNMMKEPLIVRLLFDDLQLQVQDKYYGLIGTDDKGRDLAYMIVNGLKISLFVGFIATFANIFIGVSLGLVAGYKGGRVDEVIMRICDFFMSIPGFPLLLVLAFIFNNLRLDALVAIIIVLSILGWAGMARTIRSQVLALRASVYVEAAKASGASSFYIIRKHILPGVWPLVLLYIMTGVVSNILSEAGLTFLGVLVPTWDSIGKIIQEASGISPATGGGGGGGLSMDRFHWLFFPGLILMLIAYSFYAISDAYDELINPKRRRKY